ncbi:MAG TPA: glycosyltransferase family A protein [Bacteriovoracaceae bacterium]|nr:glycosyltransferase family A protein [Bacteriovoracaceae bacterium]
MNLESYRDSVMREQEPLPLVDVDISILFITHNRSDLLEIAFQAIRDRMDFGSLRVEFIVSDDASNAEHLSRIQSLPFHKHVLAGANGGLGKNCNKGIAVASGSYILQIQDDCEFVGDGTIFSTALEILQTDCDVGIVQLTDQTPCVDHEVRCLTDGTRYLVFKNDMIPQKRDCGARPYSDQPHVKRMQFCEDIGPYREGVSMTDTELDYQQRVACQKRWRVTAIAQAPSFNHLGAARSFNPCVVRARRLERIEHYPLVGPFLRRLRPAARRLREWVRGLSL